MRDPWQLNCTQCSVDISRLHVVPHRLRDVAPDDRRYFCTWRCVDIYSCTAARHKRHTTVGIVCPECHEDDHRHVRQFEIQDIRRGIDFVFRTWLIIAVFNGVILASLIGSGMI